MKKVLLINRRIVRGATPGMFALGCFIVVIMGVTIITNNPTMIDGGELPKGFGYPLFYGGFVLLFALMIDTVFVPLGVFKLRKKQNTLRDRCT